MGVWGVMLNGVYLSGGVDDPNLELGPDCAEVDTIIAGCLTSPPDGLGLPGLRTEDITYAQRDGVKHFSDWYEPRIVTLRGIVQEDTFGACTSAREKVMLLLQAWSRTCCDTEMILFPPCESSDCTVAIAGEATVRTNLLANPSIEVNTTGWTAETNSSVILSTAEFWVGASSLKMSSLAAGASASFGSPTGTSGIPVTQGSVYSASAYVKSPVVTRQIGLALQWYNAAGTLLTEVETDSLTSDTTWQRLYTSNIAPADAAFARMRIHSLSPAASGEALYVDGLMLEQTSTEADYFDGSTTDIDPDPAIGAVQKIYNWTGTAHASTSTETSQVYVSQCTCLERILTGPYAIVGRPRKAEVRWFNGPRQIAEVLLRFDAVDHRIYLTDQCGTVGSSECVNISPGSEVFTVCLSNGLCFTESNGTWCFTQPAAAGVSVEPIDITVCGTEKVYPTITLQPNLENPRIELMTSGDYISYDGTIIDYPVEINTEDGTAFQNGVSVTHLLRGSLFMSLDPGDHQFRLLSNDESITADGLATVCWRPTVISA